VYIAFKINQDYIAKTLCINRNKPEVLCNGKCVLEKNLSEEDSQSKKEIPQKLKDQSDTVYYFDESCGLPERQTEVLSKRKRSFHYQSPFTQVCAKGIFHPPKGAA
jgi:Rad3-related DNA helicase